jgi:hypothetical protein
MLAIILCVLRFVRLLGSRYQTVAAENLALRLQLAAYERKRKRPVLTQWDRLFWVGLSPGLGWLARRADLRSARHGGGLATGTGSQILGSTVKAQKVIVEEDLPLQ